MKLSWEKLLGKRNIKFEVQMHLMNNETSLTAVQEANGRVEGMRLKGHGSCAPRPHG
jgi:hypothetical protein